MIFCSFRIACSYADITVVPPDTQLLPIPATANSASSLGEIIAWFIGLTAVLTILAITWAAINMVLATGEEEKMKKARYTMIYAFIGLVISGLAYATVNFVINLNLDTFL